MKRRTHAIIGWTTTVSLGLLFWFFFAVCYRHHGHYQEQMQLFLFTPAYFLELIGRPGGLAIYLGRFFTQFFYDSFTGGFLVALLLVALQRLVRDAANQVTRLPSAQLLTCIPSLLYAAVLCDENMLLNGLVALVGAMAAVAVYNRIGRPAARAVYYLLMVPVSYFLWGVGALVFVLLPPLTECIRRRRWTFLLTLLLPGILLFAALPFLAKAVYMQYPIERYLLAGDYYRFVHAYPVAFLSVFLFTALLPLLYRVLPRRRYAAARMQYASQLLLLALLAALGVWRVADWKKEELMAYDYYARVQKWNSILAMADKKAPTGPLTVAMLNLALSRTDHLPEYMFTYYQNGTEGLIPSFAKDHLQPLMVGEIYYWLGLINTAQRFAFDAMETIPDYQKSVRAVKRLAETNLINGRYAVAAKYLSLLENTLYYRSWAKQTRTYLANEARINAHPEWGTLRSYRPGEDFFFSETEKDQMFGLLFQQNPSNRMAYEYLLAFTLLKKDLPAFYRYYPLGEGTITYGMIPRAYREALALIWSQVNYDPARKPHGLSDRAVGRLENYRGIFTTQSDPASALKRTHGDSYWFYFHFGTN
ncbi:DUF6057 family protein [Parabacteroides sp. PF5-6]|uniref:DUF6057 family protein n=1 Tax=Parabacteroides sp. PF5-6 TaxID=1742403 RepID=UPI002404B2B6|nr:DUF6057 family protein [Parabacteroides sp. PF5-6]MDF9831428.1 hypothetical protein [Parabacteroides sp. PF5-6]